MASSVNLFSYTRDIERVCAAAMRSCYSPYSATELFDLRQGGPYALEGEKPFDEERIRGLLKKALELGHLDILEHGELTYDVRGISRACSHQLVRHRIASFSQQSQRYVKLSKSFGYVRPPSFGGRKVKVSVQGTEHEVSFEDVVEFNRQAEEQFVASGVKAEDARYLRVNAAVTNVTLTMNPRTLLHVFSLRCAPDAQWEIRGVAWAMYAAVKMIAPTIFEHLPMSGRYREVELIEERLRQAVAEAKPVFDATAPGSTVEIPLESLGLEYRVRAFVRKA